jgi:hypothetical protein
MKSKQIIGLLSILLFFYCSSYAQIQKTNYEPLTETKVTFFENNTKMKVDNNFYLDIIFLQTGVPAGIVWAKNDDIFKEFLFQPQRLTIKEALDSFTKVKSEYSWKEINGVINITPQIDYSILDIKIPEFKIEEYPWKISERIIQTKEFQQYIKEKDLVDITPKYKNLQGIFTFGPIRNKQDPKEKISIDLKNATIREILNEAVRQSNRIWSYREFDVVEDEKLYHEYRLES